ncbi:MAG: LamG domain-containing protein [Planctomycetes bacterium]|nr:LamG domain-containing protein [Planctomycetota bacterium]
MQRIHLLVATLGALSHAPAQNQALAFANGTAAYADAPYAPTLVPRGGLTVEAWLTYDGSTLGSGWRFPTVCRMDPSPNQASYFLRVEAGQTRANRLLWWVTTANGNFSIAYTFAPAVLVAGAHVAASYDGTALRLFLNGAQVAQGNATGAILDRGGVFRIGGGDLSVAGGETWNGTIDELRVWPFARTAAQIAASMGQDLSLLPGEASSWHFDGDLLDASGTNHATLTGPATFGPSVAVLQPFAFPGALNFGAASGCRSDGLAAITGLANLGNGSFAFVGTRAPASAPGFGVVSLASLPTPLPVLGIDVWVDPNLATSLFSTASSLGTASLGFPVPTNPGNVGLAFFTQFVWLDGACASGLSASNAVLASILP